jgi:uncharacterized protein YecE (DUF72 family)
MVAWIGTSGWSYDHWHPELYPPGLPPRSRLGRYSAAFPTAELNSSFYRWPAPRHSGAGGTGCLTDFACPSRHPAG